MNPLRQQLPVHSPLSWRAVRASLGRHDDAVAVAATLRTMYDAESVLLTDSGTSALAIALRLAVTRHGGGRCLLPGFGCYDLVTAALAADVPVALYDIDPETLAPRLESIAALATGDCAAIVIVHHYGVTTALDEVRTLAARSGAAVIEDVAQAAGAYWAGRRAGAGADAAILSFGRGKGVTGGQGGALLLSGTMVTTLGRSAYSALPAATNGTAVAFAKLVAQWMLARPAWYGIPARVPFLQLGETIFRPPHTPGAMPAGAIRVLHHTLATTDPEAEVRGRHADRLRVTQRRLAPGTVIRVAPESRPGWLRLPVRVPAGLRVDASRAARLGVRRSYPRPLGALDELARSLVVPPDTAGAVELSERLWTVPTHSALEERDLQALDRWLGGLADADPAGTVRVR